MTLSATGRRFLEDFQTQDRKWSGPLPGARFTFDPTCDAARYGEGSNQGNRNPREVPDSLTAREPGAHRLWGRWTRRMAAPRSKKE